jgi:hypothetical protein
MIVWDVHVTYRDETGARRSDFLGAFAADDLSQGLDAALAQAHASNGGVQVTRQRPAPKPSRGPRAA